MRVSNWPFSIRFKATFLLIILLITQVKAELLKKSLLDNLPPFKIKRDIFNYQLSGQQITQPATRNEQSNQPEDYQQMLERILLFTGVINFGGETLAIVQIESESFTVKSGETIRGLYKIVKITENELTVNYNGQNFIIRRTGE